MLNINYQLYNQQQLNNTFPSACACGDLEQIKYLLTSPDLHIHADIHIENDYGFHIACQLANFELITYLLSSEELPQQINIKNNFAVLRSEHFGFNLKTIQFLIFDLNIPIPEDINYDALYPSEVIRLFHLRTLQQNLNNNLKPTDNNNNIIKI
jgi:hypothetical protein